MSGPKAPSSLPRHYEIGRLERVISMLAIVLAFGLILLNFGRLALNHAFFHWWTPLAAFAGMAVADFVSGLVHWTADTWGSETLPIIGRRLLQPFRVHHLNPDDFLRRRFSDTNGDLALVLVPVLALLLLLPIGALRSGPTGLFAASFCLVRLLTNQVHQWAHRKHPPQLVAWLQRSRILLSHQEHALHHKQPYATNYCIATGWCNRPLAAIDFFPRCEYLVTQATGAVPRRDDHAYHTHWAQSRNAVPEGSEHHA